MLEAFDEHCNPRRNETVERFKFFSLTQEPGEPQEKLVTDLKLLATTCNFGDLKDSLMRDRIICRIQDRKLREELLKISDLDLQRCLSICWAAELSKTRTKTLEEGKAVNWLNWSCCQEKLPSDREEVFGLRKNESFCFSMPFQNESERRRIRKWKRDRWILPHAPLGGWKLSS